METSDWILMLHYLLGVAPSLSDNHALESRNAPRSFEAVRGGQLQAELGITSWSIVIFILMCICMLIHYSYTYDEEIEDG